MLDLTVAGLGIGGMGEMAGEPGLPVDLDEDFGERDSGQPRQQSVAFGEHGGIDGLGGQWRQVQLAVLVEA